MDYVSASHVKQNFGAVLARAATSPLAVRRHRKVVAALVPARWLDRHELLDERRAARAAQEQVIGSLSVLGMEQVSALPADMTMSIDADCFTAAAPERLLA
jgi:hypothetical protein